MAILDVLDRIRLFGEEQVSGIMWTEKNEGCDRSWCKGIFFRPCVSQLLFSDTVSLDALYNSELIPQPQPSTALILYSPSPKSHYTSQNHPQHKKNTAELSLIAFVRLCIIKPASNILSSRNYAMKPSTLLCLVFALHRANTGVRNPSTREYECECECGS